MNTFMGLHQLSIAKAAFLFQFAHNLTAMFLTLITILALVAVLRPDNHKLQLVWPIVIVIMSITILSYITFAFGFYNVRKWVGISLHSNELLGHFVVFMSLLIGAITVILHRTAILKNHNWSFMMAFGFIVAGLIFLLHPQKQLAGTSEIYSLNFHHGWGLSLTLIGIFYGLDVFFHTKTRYFQFIWIFIWMIEGISGLFYRINPAHFSSFTMSNTFQPSTIVCFGLSACLAMLIFLIIGIVCHTNKYS